MLKRILLLLLIILLILQIFHPKRNKAKGLQANYIGNVHALPENVLALLEKACNDCHSNNTNYPWYANLQPVDWWLNNHVKKGKKALNFDEYTHRSLRYQYHKMEEVEEQVKEEHMPLNSYLWIHKDARLTDNEKNTLIAWTHEVRNNMKARYPIDSLVRKK
jgi:hypothetical protein